MPKKSTAIAARATAITRGSSTDAPAAPEAQPVQVTTAPAPVSTEAVSPVATKKTRKPRTSVPKEAPPADQQGRLEWIDREAARQYQALKDDARAIHDLALKHLSKRATDRYASLVRSTKKLAPLDE